MNYAQVLSAFLAQLKNIDGDKYVAHRQGWNGANQFIGLCTKWNGNMLTTGPDFEIMPFTYIKSAQEKLVPWVPSQTDQLAEDWVINVVPNDAHSEIKDDQDSTSDEKPSDQIMPDGPDISSTENQSSLGDINE